MVEDLCDLTLYPITNLTSERAKTLIAHCQKQLAELGAVELPGFLTPSATELLAKEAEELAKVAFFNPVTGNPYLEPTDYSAPQDHPKRLEEPTTVGVVAYDQFPNASPLKQLYEWGPLIQFIAKALGKETLYRYADPLGALNLSIMRENDYLRWHFDQTDFVTSICLQSSTEGGEFEFAPLIRSKTDENYDAVKSVLQGKRELVHKIPMTPGTLLLFEGRYSLHRVTTIGGKRLRHVALLGYDTKPGVCSSPHLQKIRYGRSY